MIRSYKYYIKPNNIQKSNLDRIRLQCCQLYNDALTERKDAYKKQKKSISYYKQQLELKDLRKENKEYKDIFAQVLQNTLKRLDLAFQSFFRRVKLGNKPGYPRFKSNKSYNSFTFSQVSRKNISFYGGPVSFENNKLKIHGIPGLVKIKLHRKLEGIPKTATLIKEIDRWYIIFTCEVIASEKLIKTNKECGIDLGLTNFITLDNGIKISNPKYLKKSECSLRHKHRMFSKKKKGGSNRNKSRIILAKQYKHLSNQRKDFCHKLSSKLVKEYDFIAIEDLQISNMVKNRRYSKSISDVCWGIFTNYLVYKAENAGKLVIKVNPRNTSQTCSNCGCVKTGKDKLTIKDRLFICFNCGLWLDRDINAGRVILRSGRDLWLDQSVVKTVEEVIKPKSLVV